MYTFFKKMMCLVSLFVSIVICVCGLGLNSNSVYAITDDITGPSIVITQMWKTSDGRLKIEYRLEDESGIKECNIYYNNCLDYSITYDTCDNSVVDVDYYNPGTNFTGTIYIMIHAVDERNNLQIYSTVVDFNNRQTSSSGPTSSFLNFYSINNESLLFEYKVTDSDGISDFYLHITTIEGSFNVYPDLGENVTTVIYGDYLFAPQGAFDGLISISIIATDIRGNISNCTVNIPFDNCLEYDGYKYIINDNGEIEIYSYSGDGGYIEIPSSIDGKQVVLIGDYVFYRNNSITGVTIPNTVREIGREAFRDCANLTEVQMSNSVTSIGREAFRGCTSLESISLSSNLESISYAMFGSCESLRNITIPEGVEIIESCAFRGCSNLNSITVPASVIEVRDSAFSNCSNLEEVRFMGMNEIDFGWDATLGRYNVKSIFEYSDNYVVYCYENSDVHMFAEEHDWNYEVVSTGTPTNVPTTAPGAIPPATGNTVDRSAAEAFVTRCYELVLGRSPDPTGLNNWVNSLVNNQNTGAHMAYGFFFSQEYINSNTSNEEFVTTLYNVFLDRAPDQGGLNDWVGQLEAGATREQIFAGVANSREFFALCNSYGITAGHYIQGIDNTRQQNVNAFVARLYSMCLGRNGDYDGQASWVRQLIYRENSGAGVAYGFFFSPEFINRNLTNEEYAATLYRVFLGREPDQAGFNSWVSQLNGGADRLSIFRGFAHSQEYTNICSSYGIDRGSI